MERIVTISEKLKGEKGKFVLDIFKEVIPKKLLKEAVLRSEKKKRSSAKFKKTDSILFTLLMCVFSRLSYCNLFEIFFADREDLRDFGSNGIVNTTALTSARDRLGVAPLMFLFENLTHNFLAETGGLKVGNLRVKSLDGTTLKIQDSEENAAHFGYPKNEKRDGAYPLVRLASLVDIGGRLVEGICFGPYVESELSLAKPLLENLQPGILLIVDRLYYSKKLVHMLTSKNIEFVFRVREKINFEVVARLGQGDELIKVNYTLQERRENHDLPPFKIFRMITYTPRSQRPIRLLTTLLNQAEYPPEFLGKLYWCRWGIETVLKEIKHYFLDASTVTRPCHLRSKTPSRISQEIYGIMIAYNILRFKMASAAKKHSLDPRRLSFTACLEKFRGNIRLILKLPVAQREIVIREENDTFCRILVPERPGRNFRREVKVQRSAYPVKVKRPAS